MKNFWGSASFIILFALVGQMKAGPIQDSTAINKVMQQQLDAWNAGSIDGFMEGYWRDPRLRFITKKGVTYGWQTVLDNYKKSFPDLVHMGKLTFLTDHISEISKGLYLVTGVWKVETTEGNKSGYYSLLFKKISGKWLIIVDHTF